MPQVNPKDRKTPIKISPRWCLLSLTIFMGCPMASEMSWIDWMCSFAGSGARSQRGMQGPAPALAAGPGGAQPPNKLDVAVAPGCAAPKKRDRAVVY